jgi:hypothetical protein
LQRKNLLKIGLRIGNMSMTRRVEYSGWANPSGLFAEHLASLKDNFDNRCIMAKHPTADNRQSELVEVSR